NARSDADRVYFRSKHGRHGIALLRRRATRGQCERLERVGRVPALDEGVATPAATESIGRARFVLIGRRRHRRVVADERRTSLGAPPRLTHEVVFDAPSADGTEDPAG